MVALALIAALVAGQGPDAGVPWPFAGGAAVLAPANGSASASQSLLLLSPGQVAVSPLPCTAAGQLGLLTAPSACLNGDGSQDSSSGMTLSAVGSPTTQTMETSPNGSNNRAVSRQVVSVNNYFATAPQPSPGGSWSAVWFGSISAPLPASAVMMAQDDQGSNRAWYMRETTNNLQFNTYNGTVITAVAPVNTLVGGVDHVLVMTYEFVGPGNVNRVTGYVDGVQVGQSTTAPVIPVVSTPIAIGTHGGASGSEPVSTIRGAFFTSKALTPTDVQRLQAALVPVPQTAVGKLISNSRNSATWVTTSGGALVALPPGRTGVVGPPGQTGPVGGVVSSPSRTNLLTYSEQVDNAAWSKSTGITVTANTATAPDGSLTADTVTSTSAGGYVSQAVTTSASAYSGGIYVQTASGTQAGALQLYDATASAQACIATFTATTTAQRVTCATSALTASHSLQWRLYPGGTAGTGTVQAWGATLETGSVASPYCRSEGTSATCAGDVVTIPTPSWLSTREGCAKWCATVPFTGANPLASNLALVSGNAAGTARLGYVPASAQSIAISDGTHTATLATTYTSGARRCFRSTWSASDGTLNIYDVAGGTSASASGFTGFASFGTTLGIGQENGGAQPLGSIVDSVTLGSAAGGCN